MREAAELNRQLILLRYQVIRLIERLYEIIMAIEADPDDLNASEKDKSSQIEKVKLELAKLENQMKKIEQQITDTQLGKTKNDKPSKDLEGSPNKSVTGTTEAVEEKSAGQKPTEPGSESKAQDKPKDNDGTGADAESAIEKANKVMGKKSPAEP
ncbi:MAG: hypothetical protein LBD43_00340 [Holosporales bacterium]|jgi:septal ring factor EnvC (AmiA/AmiB activator)|nr:hypothetical protein [Holosporales bacterium]